MADTLNGTRHCDEYIDDPSAHAALRIFLLINRLPAVEKMLHEQFYPAPKLFADKIAQTNQGSTQRVRVVMASRFGDVGITPRLDREHGYSERVSVCSLTNFSNEP